MKKIVRPNVYSLRAYEAKEIPCKIKLDANESPYGFKIDRKIIDSLKTNRYPDPEAKHLKRSVAKIFKVQPENILQGNGSDELIYYLITTYGGPVLYPVPTFTMYGIISQALGERNIPVPLDQEFDLDVEKILVAIKKDKPKLVFLSTPNNPTGNCFSSERILKIVDVASRNGLVVVDEAYQPFASEEGFMPLLEDYKNLVILRTLSKIGFAGLRLGFLIARREIILEVNKVRLPFNLNSCSQAIAIKALNNKKLLNSYIKQISAERDRLLRGMQEIKGVTPYPSEANFILFKVDSPDRVYKSLLKKGILVRNLKAVVKGCLRVTIGTPAENSAFLRALKNSV